MPHLQANRKPGFQSINQESVTPLKMFHFSGEIRYRWVWSVDFMSFVFIFYPWLQHTVLTKPSDTVSSLISLEKTLTSSLSLSVNNLKGLITQETEVVINDALMVPSLGPYKWTSAHLSSFLSLLQAPLNHSIILTYPARRFMFITLSAASWSSGKCDQSGRETLMAGFTS